MQPIHQIIEDAPDSIPLPSDLRHRRIELILLPMDEAPPAMDDVSGDYERTLVDKIVIPSRGTLVLEQLRALRAGQDRT